MLILAASLEPFWSVIIEVSASSSNLFSLLGKISSMNLLGQSRNLAHILILDFSPDSFILICEMTQLLPLPRNNDCILSHLAFTKSRLIQSQIWVFFPKHSGLEQGRPFLILILPLWSPDTLIHLILCYKRNYPYLWDIIFVDGEYSCPGGLMFWFLVVCFFIAMVLDVIWGLYFPIADLYIIELVIIKWPLWDLWHLKHYCRP